MSLILNYSKSANSSYVDIIRSNKSIHFPNHPLRHVAIWFQTKLYKWEKSWTNLIYLPEVSKELNKHDLRFHLHQVLAQTCPEYDEVLRKLTYKIRFSTLGQIQKVDTLLPQSFPSSQSWTDQGQTWKDPPSILNHSEALSKFHNNMYINESRYNLRK